MNFPSLIIRNLLILMIVASLTSCNKKDDTLVLRTTSANMTSTKTLQLDISPGTAGCLFESDNDFIASVSSTGLITANLVGQATIKVTNAEKGFTATCRVNVQPEHLLFREPYIQFGKSKGAVMDYETRYLVEEDDTTLIYIGENSSLEVLFYVFENSAYLYSTCLIPATNPDQFQSFIDERYFLLGSDNQFTTLMTPDSQTLVGIESGITIDFNLYYALYYMPFGPSKSMGFPKPDLKRLKQIYLRK